MNIVVSKHAYDRAKERLGLNKKSADRMAMKAYEQGIDGNSLKGSIQRYILNKIESHEEMESHIYLYGDKAWVFGGYGNRLVLVTILNLSQEMTRRYKLQVA